MFVIGYNNQFAVVWRQLFCKLFGKDNYNKLLGNNPNILIDSRYDSLDIIALEPVKKILGINPMGLSAPWAESLGIIALKPVQKWLWINPMVLSVPWADSPDIIAFQKTKINQ